VNGTYHNQPVEREPSPRCGPGEKPLERSLLKLGQLWCWITCSSCLAGIFSVFSCGTQSQQVRPP